MTPQGVSESSPPDPPQPGTLSPKDDLIIPRISPESENLENGELSEGVSSIQVKEQTSNQGESPTASKASETVPAKGKSRNGKKPVCSSHPGKVREKVWHSALKRENCLTSLTSTSLAVANMSLLLAAGTLITTP